MGLVKKRLSLQYPIYNINFNNICLIVKDQIENDYLDLLDKIKKHLKVINLSFLRSNYENYPSKKQLCDSYDLFLVDDRIISSLPKAIGREFLKNKKMPYLFIFLKIKIGYKI